MLLGYTLGALRKRAKLLNVTPMTAAPAAGGRGKTHMWSREQYSVLRADRIKTLELEQAACQRNAVLLARIKGEK